MRRLLQSAGLVLLFGWNALPAPAQERMPTGSVTPVVHDLRQPLVPNGPYGPNGAGNYGPASGGVQHTPPSDGRWRPLKDCFNRQGSCCWADADSPGCTSCYAEYIFMFGTCRQWWHEPCLPYPPYPGHVRGPNGYPPNGGPGCTNCRP